MDSHEIMTTHTNDGKNLQAAETRRDRRWTGLLMALSACLLFAAGCLGQPRGGPAWEQRPAVRPIPEDFVAARAFDAVNSERLNHGLTPLTRRRDLDEASRLHAVDLVRMGRLNHISSDGRRLENRLGHIAWIWAGENLARNKGFEDPVAEAVRGWLNSPRHRDNMLRPDFTHTGLASVQDPETGFIYIVQVFILPMR